MLQGRASITSLQSGTRGVYQAGLRAQFSPRLTAHIDAFYAEGSHIESPWIAHAGIAWSF
ncbi:autotransporter outer membrane beta-barrel domain-containing protein [Klebsiella aerogenes]